jgi:undecaprenyl-diphosphatase
MYELFYGRESLNHKLFMAINHGTLPLLDAVMPVITLLGGPRQVYLYGVILLTVYFVKRKAMPAPYIAVFFLATFSGLGAESLLKHFFRVPRPPFAFGAENVRVLGYVGNSYSFPSGHAIFSFMAAFVLGHGRGWRWQAPLFLFAVLVAWSRIYVGAHYPLDVAAGAVVGIACGWLVWKCYGVGERFVRARRSGT